MGVGLAFAIFVDATIIRGVLLPATMKLLGDWNWYLPRWLQWIPELDIEGDAAPRRSARAAAWAPRRPPPRRRSPTTTTTPSGPPPGGPLCACNEAIARPIYSNMPSAKTMLTVYQHQVPPRAARAWRA